jgi:hypothetical protein
MSLGIGQADARGPTDIKGNPISTKARFDLRVHTGPSLFPQTPLEGVDSKVGISAGGSVGYSVTDWLLLGVAGQWASHRHEIEDSDVDIGHDHIFTVLPFAELRGPFSSYAYFGVGYNFNDLNDIEDVFGNTMEMDNTFAIQGGAGWDGFVSEHFAINFQVGYNYNKGEVSLVSGGSSTPLGDVNMSTIVISVGVRYFFPPLY